MIAIITHKKYEVKTCDVCRCWDPISGTCMGYCSVNQCLTVREDTCKDWEVYAGFHMKPNEEVIRPILVDVNKGKMEMMKRLQEVANAEGLVMKTGEDIDEESQYPIIFSDQVERCYYRQITKNGTYCSKKKSFFVVKNLCVGCPELPKPRGSAEIRYESLHCPYPDEMVEKEDKKTIDISKQTVLDMFGVCG